MAVSTDNLTPLAEAAADPARLRRRRAQRLRMQNLITLSYGIDTLLLLMFCIAGTVSAWVPLTYLAVAACVCGGFYAVLASSIPDQRADHNLTGFQIPIAATLQLAFLLLCPQLAFFFLAILFIIFAFGALRLDIREAFLAWIAIAIGLAVVIWNIRGEMALPNRTDFEAALVWASFTLVFGRYVLLGVYGSVLRVRLRKQADALAVSVRRVEELASRDELTKTLNRRSMLAILEQLLTAAGTHGQSVCVALLDLDLFKSINDGYGHLVGDQVLEAFARLVQATMRATDSFGRYGGEEFLVVLVGTTPELAHKLIDRIRERVAAFDWNGIAPGLTVRVSAGVAGYRLGDSIASLTARADRALYEAKKGGRNRVIVSA